MAYSRAVGKYPPMFITLVRRAAVKPVGIELHSEQEARRFRGRLYNFIAAVERIALKDPEYAELAACASAVQLIQQGTQIIAQPRSLDPDNKRIARALEEEGDWPGADESTLPPNLRALVRQPSNQPIDNQENCNDED